MNELALARCPICTSDPELYESTFSGYAFICPVCSERSLQNAYSKSEAARLWNENAQSALMASTARSAE